MSEITRKPARSGKVDYGDAVMLHESSQRRVALVPFFVPHSDHTELAIKICSYRKGPPPYEWQLIEDKSLSLKEAPARKLLEALRSHLAVAESDEQGDYLVIRVSEATADLGNHDPQKVASALTHILGRAELREFLMGTELSEELVRALRGAIRLGEMQSAVTDLRQKLDTGINAEDVYQRWCMAHTWAFGNAYVMRDDVREISSGDQLDLLLPNVIAGYRDIVELKRPDMPVLHWDEAHGNYYFAADVSRAIGQTHRYLDVLHQIAANGLRDHPEIVAYHPRAIIVIGRSADWEEEKLKALHGLNRRLSGVTVMTFDHLLAQGERLLQTIAAYEADEEVSITSDDSEFDDDIPF